MRDAEIEAFDGMPDAEIVSRVEGMVGTVEQATGRKPGWLVVSPTLRAEIKRRGLAGRLPVPLAVRDDEEAGGDVQ